MRVLFLPLSRQGYGGGEISASANQLKQTAGFSAATPNLVLKSNACLTLGEEEGRGS